MTWIYWRLTEVYMEKERPKDGADSKNDNGRNAKIIDTLGISGFGVVKIFDGCLNFRADHALLEDLGYISHLYY